MAPQPPGPGLPLAAPSVKTIVLLESIRDVEANGPLPFRAIPRKTRLACLRQSCTVILVNVFTKNMALSLGDVMTIWPRWAVMWSLAVAIYAVCKLLTWWQAAGRDVPLHRHAAYLLAWPGLDAESFLRGTVSQGVPAREWI